MGREARTRLGVLSTLLVATQLHAQPRTIELILDASGSMNAKLPGGATRLAAAKSAVEQLVAGLPDDTMLALRAYGHQSARERHDCEDTQLLAPFGPLGQVRAQVIAAAGRLQASGYTPITKVLQLAAGDFSKHGAGERVLILVSDGKETCEGDPCAMAAALHAAQASLVVHAIGFEVDAAARAQLQCIATSTGGRYFDAADVGSLAAALGRAAVAPMARVVGPGREPGNLRVKGADLMGHDVFEASSGKQVGSLSALQDTIRVAPGLYHVQFGAARWKSVAVKPGELTTLEPGVLQIQPAGLQGHQVRDSETGKVMGEVSSIKSSITILPGVYDISFGNIVWPLIKVDGGTTTRVSPGRLVVPGASFQGHTVRTAGGAEVGQVSALMSSMPLPPGDYTVELGGRRVPFALTEGATVTLQPPK